MAFVLSTPCLRTQGDETALHRLEPSGAKVIHGAGQSPDAFRDYFGAMGDDKPMIYMTYCSLRDSPALVAEKFAKLKSELESYKEAFLIPQVGLSMTHDGVPKEHYEDKVASGALDANIEAVCDGFRSLGRPAFVRIGYECDGPWNGYRPKSYVDAWKRIVGKIRSHGLNDVATIWCVAIDGRKPHYMDFYPGDDVVDWWSLDLFSTDKLKPHGSGDDFVGLAAQRGFPVIIGESTPKGLGVLKGEDSWQKWFAPYFAFIADHPAVKAFCYISRDWTAFPQYPNWGDSRVMDNAAVLARYRTELANPRYIQGTDGAKTRAILHVAGTSDLGGSK